MQRNDQLCGDDNNIYTEFKIIFVRHGESDWSREHVFKGDQDLPLNETGRKQAEEAALFLQTFLKDAPNPQIVASPLQRAFGTAQMISEITGITISEQKYALREFYDYSKIKDFPPELLLPSTETKEIFQKRILKVLSELLLEYNQADPLVIVSHQNVFRYLSEQLTQKEESLPYAGVAYFKRNTDGAWELDILNVKEDIRKSPSFLY